MANAFSFQWENMRVTVTEKQISFFRISGKQKVILNNGVYSVSGYGNSNSLVAIFGPSGCGKTTLLGAVSGRIKDKKGVLKMNNKVVTNNYIRSISGYIPQEDMFTESLTVLEHMKFMTALKLNKRKEERNLKIKKLLTELCLDESKDTTLGLLSGGERRRVSLATELISDPCILFCDEPTTGLDSFTALSVVQKLEEIAMTEKLVLTTVHQPSSQLFDLFNNIILLANGRMIFQGSKQKAKLFFESASLYCPVSFNPADFYLKCLTIDSNQEEKSEREINRLSEHFYKNYYEKVNNVNNNLISPMLNENVSQKSCFFQLGWLVWRACIDSKRNLCKYWTSCALLMITSLILAVTFSKVNLDSSSSVQNIQGALVLMISELVFTHMYWVVHVFPDELYIFIWEKSVYSSFPYFLSKLLSLIPMCFVNSLTFLLIYFFILQFMAGIELFFSMFVILLATSLCGICLGLSLSAIFSTLEYIELFIVPFDLITMILSGIWIKIDTVPKIFGVLKYLSPFYFGFRAVSTLFWERVDHLANCTSEVVLPCYENGEEVLERFGFSEENHAVIYNTLYMCILIVGYCYIGYLGILRKRALYELY